MISLLPDYVNSLEKNVAVKDNLQKAYQNASDMSNIITTPVSILHFY